MSVTLVSRLPAIAAQLPIKAGLVVQKTVTDIEAHWKNNIESWPTIDTGAYLNSVQGRMTGQMSGEVTSGIDYGPYLEYGTYKMAARPSAVPAAHEAEGQFIAAMKQIVS